MPAHTGADSNGAYFQCGKHGKRYYYSIGNALSRKYVMQQASLPGRAVEWKR